ncbi:MAG TPA: hypothetical protein PK385_12520 [Spirochaetota bacterium]|nr:hypothetical protein [Spirochaetota bacterium]HOS33936.1 hypothetical protein [Spirochaetota bacterium]HOS56869.1 hypothetical protein [Spirochaetota bacterium]HQF78889.1 hypothetical protein [Spirochaetota bacterium]HQJ05166.1 hypothetical protein [Spirochaetota bacterium]
MKLFFEILNGIDEGIIKSFDDFSLIKIGTEDDMSIKINDLNCLETIEICNDNDSIVARLTKGVSFFINNEKIIGAVQLNNGDLIQIGKTLIYLGINTDRIERHSILQKVK